MRKLTIIFTIAILLMCCIPASAQNTIATAPTGQAIWSVKMVAPPQSSGTISAQLYNGNTVSGSWTYSGFPLTTTTVTLGGESSSGNYMVTGLVSPLYMELWNADNTTASVRKLKLGYGQVRIGGTGLWNDYVETDIAKSPIREFTLNSDQEIEIEYEYISESEASKKLNDEREQSILELAYIVFWDVLPFGYSLYYWLKFFFVDNLGMIVALFLAVPMAFAAKNSRGNPEKFLRQYFKTLKGFFEFILSIWQRLIDTIGTVRGWFRI